jgi:hypothetical protein
VVGFLAVAITRCPGFRAWIARAEPKPEEAPVMNHALEVDVVEVMIVDFPVGHFGWVWVFSISQPVDPLGHLLTRPYIQLPFNS